MESCSLGAKRIAVELDLTAKRTEQYEQLLRAYAVDRTVQGVLVVRSQRSGL